MTECEELSHIKIKKHFDHLIVWGHVVNLTFTLQFSSFLWRWTNVNVLNLFEDMKKAALPIFSCYSLFVGNSSKNFLTFSFHSFTTLLWKFKTIPSTIPKLFSLNQGHSSKEPFLWLSLCLSLCLSVFLSPSLSLCLSVYLLSWDKDGKMGLIKTEVLKNKILELPNFGHMARSKTCFNSRDNFFN